MFAHIACKDTAKIYISSSFLFDLTKKVLPLQPIAKVAVFFLLFNNNISNAKDNF